MVFVYMKKITVENISKKRLVFSFFYLLHDAGVVWLNWIYKSMNFYILLDLFNTFSVFSIQFSKILNKFLSNGVFFYKMFHFFSQNLKCFFLVVTAAPHPTFAAVGTSFNTNSVMLNVIDVLFDPMKTTESIESKTSEWFLNLIYFVFEFSNCSQKLEVWHIFSSKAEAINLVQFFVYTFLPILRIIIKIWVRLL